MYPVSNRNRFIIRIPPTQCSCPFVNRQLILTFCSSFIQLLSSSPASSLCQRPFLNDRKCYRFLEWLITYYKSSTYTLTTSLACQPLSWYFFSFPSVWPTVDCILSNILSKIVKDWWQLLIRVPQPAQCRFCYVFDRWPHIKWQKPRGKDNGQEHVYGVLEIVNT